MIRSLLRPVSVRSATRREPAAAGMVAGLLAVLLFAMYGAPCQPCDHLHLREGRVGAAAVVEFEPTPGETDSGSGHEPPLRHRCHSEAPLGMAVVHGWQADPTCVGLVAAVPTLLSLEPGQPLVAHMASVLARHTGPPGARGGRCVLAASCVCRS